MRLWHQKLIPYLDDKRLLAQHRECCALRGAGWGKKHSTVDYIFKHPFSHLFWYHQMVISEMINRKFSVDVCWQIHTYRGKKFMYSASGSDFVEKDFADLCDKCGWVLSDKQPIIYSEHDDKYLAECLDNLLSKNAILKNASIEEMRLNLAAKGF